MGADGLGAVVRRLGQWTESWVVLLDAAGERVHAFGARRVPDLSAELVRLRASFRLLL